MKNTVHKYDRVSILDIMVKLNWQGWNLFLKDCLDKNDVEKLKRTLYGIQYDMSELAKQKLNSSMVTSLFLRLQKSLQDTAKKVYRKIHQNPCNNPKSAKQFLEFKDAKKKADQAFQLWLRESSY